MTALTIFLPKEISKDTSKDIVTGINKAQHKVKDTVKVQLYYSLGHLNKIHINGIDKDKVNSTTNWIGTRAPLATYRVS